MCGIFGVIGAKTPVQDVLEGLGRLEYRGYDSAGVATVSNGAITMTRSMGKLQSLRDKLSASPLPNSSPIAIGHTRWATHGEPSETNAHPHQGPTCAVVHNGIIENYQPLKEALTAEGFVFQSQTDTEVVPMLISKFIKEGKGKLDAVVETLNKVEGAFALGIVFNDDPDTLFAARRGSPLLTGHGTTENYIASDAIAVAPFTQKVTYLENDDIAVLTAESIKFYDKTGTAVERTPKIVDTSAATTGKDGFRHFMLKEIHQQPQVMATILAHYLDDQHKDILLPKMPFNLADIEQLNFVACGTSCYAAMVARYWFEELAHTHVNVDVASEFRYRNPPLNLNGLSIFISQSGETADTLAGLELVKGAGQHSLGLVNVPTSTIAREADTMLELLAGPEIGVASTKAFTAQLMVLALLAIKMAEAKGHIDAAKRQELISELVKVPTQMTEVLDHASDLEAMAETIAPATSALYLGRGALFPLALEGALKLKEISYIHAEGAASGEMKHGLIALVDDKMPIVALANTGPLLEKTISNVQEVMARKGRMYLIADKKAAKLAGSMNGGTFTVPETAPFVAPLLQALPIQLLAYHVAVLKGTDVDQPRNLAKSVTVE